MAVKYNDNFIIPAPFVSIDHEKIKTDDQRNIGNKFSITLTGSFLSYFSGIYGTESENVKISYDSDAALSLLIDKQNQLINLFSEDGKALEVIGLDEENSMIFYPKIESINFGEGNWFQKCDYTVNMSAAVKYSSGIAIPVHSTGEVNDWYIKSLDDSYKMTNNNDGSAEISRSMNAVGDEVYDSGNPGQLLYGVYPWQQASGWCTDNDSELIETWYSGILEKVLPEWELIDSKVEINIDPYGGSYNIERGWIISNTGVYITSRKYSEREE